MHRIYGRFAAFRKACAPLAAAAALFVISGCSSVNPFASDDSPLPLPPPLETDADGNVPDETGRKGEAGTETAQEAEGEYPDLADVPEGGQATKAAEKTPEAVTKREELAEGLVADREQAKYTDEELRGGRVAAVASPRPQPALPPRAQEDMEDAQSAETPPPAVAPTPDPVQRAAPAPAPAPVAAVPLAPRPAPVQAPPAAVAAAPARAAPAYSSNSFQPSTAQPLPADLAASLPAGVAQRYQETLRKPAPGIPSALPVAPIMARRGGAFASIPFASGSSQLSSADKQTVAQVARAARNGFGAIRVVGHASSSAASQSESQRMFANWEVSQARATAVADELVRQGVDAARIIIEAVGDSQAGAITGNGDAEAASRRVDLFLE